MPRLPGDGHLDHLDRGCIDIVARYGWQVTVVGGAPCEKCGDHSLPEGSPPFAYTVGLRHSAGHPELAMTGLPPAVMHAALNGVADRIVRHGHRVRPGDVIESALPYAPVTVDRVSDIGMARVGRLSAWFHRREVAALQLVWPTGSGIFAWQPGAPPILDELQPPMWRIASPRTGGVAVDPPWPLPARPDDMAAICIHLHQDNEPLRVVGRDQDDDGTEFWSFHCGRDHGPGVDQLLGVHTGHVVRTAPSIREVADLRVREYAERDDAFSPWRRGFEFEA